MAGSRPPHLILLLADQLRCDVLGTYGDKQTQTPRLDSLAQQSITFENHYTTAPLCIPARASLMTGLYPHQHRAIINGWFPADREHGTLRPDLPLLPARLLSQGYRVVHIGAQHIRSRPDFWSLLPEVEFQGPAAYADYRKNLESRGLFLGDAKASRVPVAEFELGRPQAYTAEAPRPMPFPLREDLYYDHILARKMAQAILQHDPQKPLALMGMFWLPQPPLWAPDSYAHLLSTKFVKLPEDVGQWYPGMPASQLLNIPGQLGAHIPHEQWRSVWTMYIGMVALLDKCIGIVLDALQERGMLDDAAIAFSSDHGEMLGSHSLFQKMCMYEPVTRVPMLLKLPRQSQPQRVQSLTDHLDLCASWLDLSGSQPLPGCSGQSLVPSSAHSRPPAKAHVFASYDGNAGRAFPQRMVRSRTHKLIINFGDRDELYDLIDDPLETRNLAGVDEHREVEAELRAALRQWMQRTQDDHLAKLG